MLRPNFIEVYLKIHDFIKGKLLSGLPFFKIILTFPFPFIFTLMVANSSINQHETVWDTSNILFGVYHWLL